MVLRRRATACRIFLKRIGTGTEFINVDDASDLDYTFKNLTPGATIEVYIIAATSGLNAPPSPTVSKVVGA